MPPVLWCPWCHQCHRAISQQCCDHLSLMQHEMGVAEGALDDVTAAALTPDSSFFLPALLRKISQW